MNQCYHRKKHIWFQNILFASEVNSKLRANCSVGNIFLKIMKTCENWNQLFEKWDFIENILLKK